MQFLKATLRISLVFFFSWISLIVVAQTETDLTKYQNDKYRFSFSYPSQFLLEVVNEDEWIIRKADGSWAIGFKIIHLRGMSFENYVNNLSANLYSTLATGYGLSNTTNGKPEINPYGKYLLSGFEFSLYISGSLGGGSGLDQLTKSWNLYLNIFRKTTHPGFVPDGILIYDFRQPLDTDNHKLTKLVIKSLEKTMSFKEVIVAKPVVTTAPPKKPVPTTPAVKKPVTAKTPQSNRHTASDDKLKTVKIGKQIWMLKNLDVAKYRNGDLIPNVTDGEEWIKLTTGAWCYYKNDSATYAATYGKLYNWYAVNDPRGLAPIGSHIPSYDEWTTLEKYLGGYQVAGGKMKEKGITHWQTPNTKATNSSGFTGLPGGNRYLDGVDNHEGKWGFWWSSSKFESQYDSLTARYQNLKFDLPYALGSTQYKHCGFSVRCIKD